MLLLDAQSCFEVQGLCETTHASWRALGNSSASMSAGSGGVFPWASIEGRRFSSPSAGNVPCSFLPAPALVLCRACNVAGWIFGVFSLWTIQDRRSSRHRDCLRDSMPFRHHEKQLETRGRSTGKAAISKRGQAKSTPTSPSSKRAREGLNPSLRDGL